VELELIDAHIHLHKDIEKERQALPLPGRRDRDRWGNADAITRHLDWEGVSYALSLNLFPTPVMRRALRAKIPPEVTGAERTAAEEAVEADLANRLRGQNAWLCSFSQQQPRVLAGIGIQKLLTPDEMVAEVELRVASGARAVKLIPGWYREFPHDRAYWPMYERCQELGIPVVSDTGTLGLGEHGAYPDEINKICYGEPLAFEDVLASFPRLTLVMAHFASAYWDERVELALRYPNLSFDISGGFDAPGLKVRDGHRALHEHDAVRVMRRIGIERFMFGSDGPHVMVQPYVEQVLRLGLSTDELTLLLSGNARRIYAIPG
jgi:predicted TIM-barrel fold metal-dependent hydrolase